MPDDEVKSVKLMRSPIDTRCAGEGCDKELLFGSWIYYNSETNDALCIECGVKRGWSAKDRVQLVIGKLELTEDVKALRDEKKFLASDVFALKQQIDIFHLGEGDQRLRGEITKLMKTVEEYLKSCGSTSEKEGLKKVFDVIHESQDLQKEIRGHVENHIFRRRDKRKVLEEEDQAEEAA